MPYDAAGLTINLDTCTLTCADSIANPQIIINPQLQVNGTIACTAGMSLSGGDLIVWSKITTPYVGSATDLQLYPTGNVRVMGNKTLFCNAISQNDTNTDLYLTAGGTNQNVVLSPAGTGQVQVLTGKTLSADNIVSKGLSVNGNVTAARLQPYDTAGLVIDLNACTITCTDAVSNPQIIMSSPVLANILTINTIKSADATNLTINSPGGTVLTNATNITASGALTLSSNGTLTLQASTGNSSVNISGTGSGVVSIISPLLVNTIIPYNSADLSLAASGINGNVNLTATGSGTIKSNSPLTVSTITSPAATNLAINSPGGTINTNATNITSTGALTLNSTNARLTLNAGVYTVYVSSQAFFNNSIACSSFTNGVNNNIVMTPLTGTITLSTNNANNINITPGGLTSFGGGGIQLPNGGSTLKWYEEATLTGTWSNVTETVQLITLYITRIGSQVFISMSSSFATPNDSVNQPILSATLPSKFRPAIQVNQSNYNGNVNPYTIRITVAGVISIQTYTLNATITPIMNFSYFSNAVTTAGATGQDGETGGASGASGASGGDITGGSDIPKP